MFCWSASGIAAVKLPALISNGMVLQRNTELRIWGWADATERVSLSFNNRNYQAVTASDGKWNITLPAMKAGGPYRMNIDATNHIVIDNILIGDVWVCSGQSNMELPMSRVKVKYEDVISKSTNSEIRQFNIATTYNFRAKQEDIASASWKEANPENVLAFSAVAYFFAKELYQKYKVPIGLIKSAVGGSPAEAWLSEEALKEYPDFLALTNRYKDDAMVDSIKKMDAAIANNWNERIEKEDSGLNIPVKWYEQNYDASSWLTTKVPGYWDDSRLFDYNKSENYEQIAGSFNKTENINGVIWFRKEVDVPASMLNKPALLVLGAIVDRDIVYVNGQFAGTTGYQYPPRRYELPANLLKAGKNIITVRVISNSGRGGFVPDKEYSLKAGNDVIDLKGDWQYKLGYASEPMPGGGTTFQYQPAGLFNAMIAPLLNYKIKGVIWYQGESNTSNPKAYKKLFSDVILDWRKHWNQGDFPFLYVQLANFMQAKSQPSESNWAELREAQLKTLEVPNTAMAVTLDIGEWNDIHPLNKEDVGKRLALSAYTIAYGDKNVVYSGPVYQSMKVKGNKIILAFSNTGSGLIANGSDSLKYFSIAGADKKFVWARAQIKGNKVEVWSDSIANPVAVRYAWADNPEGANLYNKQNLPASSFRTDEY